MLLTYAQVTLFKSIEDSDDVAIEPDITIFVGQNESGKTAFMQALYKSSPADEHVTFNVVEDFPRKSLNQYEKKYQDAPPIATTLYYQLYEDELAKINQAINCELLESLELSVSFQYNGEQIVALSIDEQAYIQPLIKQVKLPTEIATAALQAESVAELIEILDELDLNKKSTRFLDGLKTQFEEPPEGWGVLEYYIWQQHILPNLPRFLYFDEYKLLPGKVNLPALLEKINHKDSDHILNDEDRTVMKLLDLAGVDIKELAHTTSYEKSQARLEAISNAMSDKIYEYWSQNKDLEVQFDIKTDPDDVTPFNNGNNLYIRIRNTKHRISLPFDQRSKGFVWFFSFMVWFDSYLEASDSHVILLLDEPGLNLHAVAQNDLLKYIQTLSEHHQVIYTTHSPYMIPSTQFSHIRFVEDRIKQGTKITDNIQVTNPFTLYPLHMALGYAVIENLLPQQSSVIVGNIADLIYLEYFSAILDHNRRISLCKDCVIIPAGGLDKLAVYMSLVKSEAAKSVLLCSQDVLPDETMKSFEQIITKNNILKYHHFRDSKIKSGTIEDLFSPTMYLKIFMEAYKDVFAGTDINVANLPAGNTILERIRDYLTDKSIELCDQGCFDRNYVAQQLMLKPLPPSRIDAKTLDRFENLFEDINRLL